MKLDLKLPIILGILAVIVGLISLTFERPVGKVVAQWGYRGTGMAQVYSAKTIAANDKANIVPEADDKVENSGQLASKVYQNVQVLGNLDENQFNRLMGAITAWVSPEQGCAYCHGEEGNFAEDKLYTKIVARRMLQMTQDLNANWQAHVAPAGVTCYTCHRGNNVPANIWFNNEPGGSVAGSMAPKANGKYTPVKATGYTGLPYDYGTNFLEQDNSVKVASATALPEYDRGQTGASVQRTGYTFGLMIHMSTSLGVNCSYCHNTNNFSSYEVPQKAKAWHALRMVRTLNTGYMDPLKAAYVDQAPNRLGVMGDAPKANCATCHQGAYKPLNGVSMIKDYPDLAPATAATVAYASENAAK